MAPTPSTMTAEFLHYNRWANLVLLDACIGLDDEQLAGGLPGGYGTIYDTFVHIIRAEAGYYRRLADVRLEPPFAWDSRPPLTAMRPYADQVGSALVASAEQLDPAGVIEQEWDGQIHRYRAAAHLHPGGQPRRRAPDQHHDDPGAAGHRAARRRRVGLHDGATRADGGVTARTTMNRLTGICIITHDVARLRDFYCVLLQVEAQGDDVFAELYAAGDAAVALQCAGHGAAGARRAGRRRARALYP